MVDLACGCRKGLQLPDRLCPYHEGYQDGYDAGFADGVEGPMPGTDQAATILAIQWALGGVIDCARDWRYSDEAIGSMLRHRLSHIDGKVSAKSDQNDGSDG